MSTLRIAFRLAVRKKARVGRAGNQEYTNTGKDHYLTGMYGLKRKNMDTKKAALRRLDCITWCEGRTQITT